MAVLYLSGPVIVLDEVLKFISVSRFRCDWWCLVLNVNEQANFVSKEMGG